jgi:aldehyde dehydrogenase (NAD+)
MNKSTPIQNQIVRLLEKQRAFFATGKTRRLDFRLQQLSKLKHAITQHEAEILAALKKDLNKSEFEAFTSEVGFIYDEIKHTKAHLARWMAPKKVKTPLLHLPSKSFIIQEPKGVVLIISPWNYPFQLLLAPLVGAIAAGNCAVLKPSEMAPHTAAVLTRLIGGTFPSDFCAVLGGGVPEATALLAERFDHIFFTGATTVGRIVMQAAAVHLTPVTLELGGKSPCIVDAEVNLEVAARRIVWGKFYNAGQTCVAPDYLLVQRKIKKPLLQSIKANIDLFYGKNAQQSPDYGRIINAHHFERLSSLLQESRAKVVFGGKSDAKDLYIEPTVIDRVELTDPVMMDEIFGPLLPVLEYETLDEALAIVAQRPSPLAAYVFTSDQATEKRFLTEVSFGGGCVNNVLVHLANPDLPFGGIADSGMGAYHGEESFLTFSHRKSILKTSTKIDPALKYPPYGNRLRLLRRFIG